MRGVGSTGSAGHVAGRNGQVTLEDFSFPHATGASELVLRQVRRYGDSRVEDLERSDFTPPPLAAGWGAVRAPRRAGRACA